MKSFLENWNDVRKEWSLWLKWVSKNFKIQEVTGFYRLFRKPHKSQTANRILMNCAVVAYNL